MFEGDPISLLKENLLTIPAPVIGTQTVPLQNILLKVLPTLLVLGAVMGVGPPRIPLTSPLIVEQLTLGAITGALRSLVRPPVARPHVYIEFIATVIIVR